MIHQRLPMPSLRPLVSQIWTNDDSLDMGAGERPPGSASSTPSKASAPAREWGLPTGAMHVAIRLVDSHLDGVGNRRVLEGHDAVPASGRPSEFEITPVLGRYARRQLICPIPRAR